MMFHPEHYEEHNLSLNRFIRRFNGSDVFKNVLMIKTPEENYLSDGFYIDMDTGRTMGFDWTKSSKEKYRDGRFMYEQILIVDSKTNIATNTLIIETDTSEEYFSVVFAEDLRKSPIVYFSDTAGGEPIRRQARKTKKFETYSYEQIGGFKSMVREALSTGTFNHSIFKWRTQETC